VRGVGKAVLEEVAEEVDEVALVEVEVADRVAELEPAAIVRELQISPSMSGHMSSSLKKRTNCMK
jgi:hypothetical protein